MISVWMICSKINFNRLQTRSLKIRSKGLLIMLILAHQRRYVHVHKQMFHNPLLLHVRCLSWQNKNSLQVWRFLEIYVLTVRLNYLKKLWKSFNLEEIPGLLTINKAKPKDLNKNKNISVTNVLVGSMEGQDIFQLVESIDDEKKEKQNQKRKKTKQKDKEKELFYGSKVCL